MHHGRVAGQMLCGRLPKVSVRKTSFKIGKASPDAVCNLRNWFGYLSGKPAEMSGLATWTYAPVFTITRHGLSSTQPWVTRLGSAFSVMTVNAGRGGLNVSVGVRPSPALTRFPTSSHSSCPLPWRYSVAFLIFLEVPVMSLGGLSSRCWHRSFVATCP
jgi:hypothetical protein